MLYRGVKQRFTRLLLHPLSALLLICVVLLGGQCGAQEVDVPTGRGNGSVVAPSDWVELIAPVQQWGDLKFYGFYIGEVNAPSTQFDATFRATKFFRSLPVICITRSLQPGLMNSRIVREDLLAVS